MSQSSQTPGGVSLPVVLTLIFVVLKLVGVIDWPWLWVLSPLWIAVGLVVTFFVFVSSCVLVFLALHKSQR